MQRVGARRSMAVQEASVVASPVEFTGERAELLGKLLGGYLLMVPTLGVYRFWVTTAKRRFYWQNTVIDGDPLEYTGNPRQLLIGFLFAVAFFLPVYIAFFLFSTQAGLVTVAGYAVLGAVLWFFTGYAQYRGRDFRLSRTLWRGIRFDQQGSAMNYAVRRFGWSLLVVATAGLAYPFMSADLWRYRYSNSWFGDRQVSFAGTWKTVAGPFYRAYGAIAAAVILTVLLKATVIGGLATMAIAVLAFFYWRSREASRMFSSISLGEVQVKVRVKARMLFAQYFALGFILAVLLFVASLVGGFVINPIISGSGMLADGGLGSLAYSNLGSAVIVIGGYLLSFGTFSLLAETIIDFGYWELVSTGATLSNVESLGSVRAIREDKALVGEGIADALNVGSF